MLLGIAGGICPLLPMSTTEHALVISLGYVFFALAAGLVLLDQVFGFSSSWMRFTTARLRPSGRVRFGSKSIS